MSSEEVSRKTTSSARKPDFLLVEARRLVEAKDTARAIERLEAVLALEPTHPEARKLLARVRGEEAEALERYLDKLVLEAEACLEKRETGSAYTLADRVLQLRPDHERALELLETTYVVLPSLQEAPLDLAPTPPQDDSQLETARRIAEIDRLLALADAPADRTGETKPPSGFDPNATRPIATRSPKRSEVAEPARRQGRTEARAPQRPRPISEPPAEGPTRVLEAPPAAPEIPTARKDEPRPSQPSRPSVPPVSTRPVQHGVRRRAGAPPPKRGRALGAAVLAASALIAVLLVLRNRDVDEPPPPPPPTSSPAVVENPNPPPPSPPRTTTVRVAPPVPPPPETPTETKFSDHVEALPGNLSVSWKSSATVRIRGQDRPAKRAPCTFEDLKPGQYSVEISDSLFGLEVRRVEVKPGESLKLAGEFPPAGELSVNAFPWAKVFIRGQDQGETPLRLKLRPGTYEVLLRHPDFGDKILRVKIGPSGEEKISHRFE